MLCTPESEETDIISMRMKAKCMWMCALHKHTMRGSWKKGRYRKAPEKSFLFSFVFLEKVTGYFINHLENTDSDKTSKENTARVA